jgi:ABC-type antimicrobial peptide transport system permease subunit
VLRSDLPTGLVAEAARAEIRNFDRTQPIGEVTTMDDVVRRSAGPYRFRTQVVVGFAALALLLATTGIFGVVSVLAQARRSELAIRRALGSTVLGLVRLVMAQGVAPVLIGLMLGGAGVVLSARLVQALLFGVGAIDPTALATAGAAMAVTAIVAMLPPAWESATRDPMSVLRRE